VVVDVEVVEIVAGQVKVRKRGGSKNETLKIVRVAKIRNLAEISTSTAWLDPITGYYVSKEESLPLLGLC